MTAKTQVVTDMWTYFCTLSQFLSMWPKRGVTCLPDNKQAYLSDNVIHLSHHYSKMRLLKVSWTLTVTRVKATTGSSLVMFNTVYKTFTRQLTSFQSQQCRLSSELPLWRGSGVKPTSEGGEPALTATKKPADCGYATRTRRPAARLIGQWEGDTDPPTVERARSEADYRAVGSK